MILVIFQFTALNPNMFDLDSMFVLQLQTFKTSVHYKKWNFTVIVVSFTISWTKLSMARISQTNKNFFFLTQIEDLTFASENDAKQKFTHKIERKDGSKMVVMCLSVKNSSWTECAIPLENDVSQRNWWYKGIRWKRTCFDSMQLYYYLNPFLFFLLCVCFAGHVVEEAIEPIHLYTRPTATSLVWLYTFSHNLTHTHSYVYKQSHTRT